MNQKTDTANKRRVHDLAVIAIMAAVTCILAPLSIPIGPVPISLTNLAVFFSLYLLGWKRGSLSLLVYLLVGLAGLPVFSGFTGGPAKLLGPTGGYIVGFLPMALISGLIIEKANTPVLQFLGMLLGTAVCYTLGTLWFCSVTDSALIPALSLCVYPFLPLDLAKMLLALVFGPMIRRRLTQARLLP